MLNVTKLREQLAAKLDEVAAVNALCEKESREPTADEMAVVNANIGEDGKSGIVAKLKNDIARAEAFDNEVKAQAAKRAPAGVQHEVDPVNRPTIPAEARWHSGAINSFKGSDKELHAFTAGQFFKAALTGNQKATEWLANNGHNIRNAHSEGDASKGGIFVPTILETSVIELMVQYGVLSGNVTAKPMSSAAQEFPYRVSGLTAYWGKEATALATATDKVWNKYRLVAKKMYALTYWSDELSEDATIQLGNDLTREMAYAMSYKEDDTLFNGDASDTYEGITGLKNGVAAGSIVTTATGELAFSDLTNVHFGSVMAKLPNYGGIRPKWYVSKAGWEQSMARLQYAAGGNTAMDLGNGLTPMFRGYPVVWSELMPTTDQDQASTIIAYFGDLDMACLFGRRRGMTVQTSTEVKWLEGQTAMKATQRIDLYFHSRGTANAAGAVVALKTAAS